MRDGQVDAMHDPLAPIVFFDALQRLFQPCLPLDPAEGQPCDQVFLYQKGHDQRTG